MLLRALDSRGRGRGRRGARVLAALVASGGVRARARAWLELTPSGILDLLALHAEIERALDPAPRYRSRRSVRRCPG